MKKLLFITTSLLFLSSVFSQKTISAYDIDIISIDTTGNNIYFYKKVTENQYNELTYNVDNKKSFKLEFKVDDYTYTKDEIIDDDELTFSIADIKKTNPKNYLKQKWLFELKDEAEEDKYKQVSAINSNILGVNNIYFGKKRFNSGMGSSSTHLPDDNDKKWRSDYAKFFEIEVFKLKNGANLFLFFDEYYNLDGFLIPHKKNAYFSYNNNNFTKLKLSKTNYKINLHKSLNRFYFNDFYKLQKVKDQYQLQTKSKTPIIPKLYDTILYNNFYIIGKKKNKTDIYNYKLNKLKIPDLKSAYYKNRWLDILTKKEAKYIDEQLNEIKTFPTSYTTVCGTVPSLNADINKSNKDKSYYLEYSIANFAEKADIKRIKFKNILQTDSITFLDKSKEFYVDGNKVPIITKKLLFEQLYRVKRNEKTGLFQIKDSIKFTKEPLKEKIEDLFLKPQEISIYQTSVCLTQLLPFEFDKIEYKNRLIYIEQGTKKGYLHNLTPMLFDEFEKQTHSFFRIKKNDKYGFIDVKTGEEYY